MLIGEFMGSAPGALVSAAVLGSAVGLGAPPPSDDGALWGDVTCERSTSGCELGAGAQRDGSHVEAPQRRPDAARHRGADDSPAVADPICTSSAEVIGDIRADWETRYEIGSQERLYLEECNPGGPRWVVVGPGEDPPVSAAVPDPAHLAARARDHLVLPEVRPGVSPSGTQLVGLPTWLWLDRSGWEPVSRTVSVPGVSVTARAVPESVVWSMGDHASVACQAPGTPFPAGTDPEARSPDCGHVYRAPSEPDGFTVSVTVRWSVSWSGAGESGVFEDLESTATIQMPVVEVPAVNTVPVGEGR